MDAADGSFIEDAVSTIIASVVAGAGVGLSIAAPIGATSMLCVQRTLAAGLPTGLATGFGVATVHLSYGILAVGWGTAFASVWSDAALLSLASGVVLLAFSIRVLRSALVLREVGEPRRSLASTYCSAVGCAFLNPVTPILFAAATPTLLGDTTAHVEALVTGVFLGSFGWWIALSAAVSSLRGRLTGSVLTMANRAAGLLLAALAVGMLAKGLAGSPRAVASGWAGEGTECRPSRSVATAEPCGARSTGAGQQRERASKVGRYRG